MLAGVLVWNGEVAPGERCELSFPAVHRGTPSPKRMSSGRGGRDRFTAESYTVLGKDGRYRDLRA